ncbi:hypothetical protein SAMN05192558_11353 [Actinokineospora alba]|uniref:Uncharacterized protein n=1 Tax=Actinokineospora alba TaxID=504798 RepID=A0A1H0V727_9PSEU|nr:hypothetical protein [Actinokineospora alba]TDP65503.1 hypothetical protein C8E96_0986 [Actinokineospora alba]SDH64096.1 hypothetical protein SAMN05421871_101807 [Actinokineospora alba]SDP74183.1 hypothetical protein SAMN05192558_11353 [Actinokineospora alba]
MPGEDSPSWRLTSAEKRKGVFASLEIVSALAGPLGPLALWAFEYLYDRRDLIFTQSGMPVQAFTARGAPLRLGSLDDRGSSQLGSLSINPALTPAARALGLRAGDPVSVVVSGHRFVQGRSGLVIPARIGSPLTVAVPRGSYSLSAFGGTRNSLFTLADPYTGVSGTTVQVGQHSSLDLPLRSRITAVSASPGKPDYSTFFATKPQVTRPAATTDFKKLLATRPQPTRPATTNFGKLVANQQASIARQTPQPCVWCRQAIPDDQRYLHILGCPSRPAAQQPSRPETLWDRILRFIDEF